MSKSPTAAQRRRMALVAEIGCILDDCRMPAIIHHCGTGGGGRRDHDKILPICPRHHKGYGSGISFHDGRKTWEGIYGTEVELLKKLNDKLSARQEYKENLKC